MRASRVLGLALSVLGGYSTTTAAEPGGAPSESTATVDLSGNWAFAYTARRVEQVAAGGRIRDGVRWDRVKAELAPKFSYGCAVFLDSDRVNFQKEGYSKEELLAGLALVLPKNVWQYVVQIPRMASLGRKFVLQGGTQYNLAAVKAQVDYIKERVPDGEVYVHPHTGEAGAIGAAMETIRVVKRRGSSTFIGLDDAINLEYTSKNDEETVCHFCPNECKRTFIDTKTPDGRSSRYIAGFSCEKGTVESHDAMVALVAERKKIVEGIDGFLLHSRWLDEIIAKVRGSGKRELTVADFKVMTGLSRKYSIPLLELLDSMGVTRRKGSVRDIL